MHGQNHIKKDLLVFRSITFFETFTTGLQTGD